MVKKSLFLFFLIVICNFCCHTIFGQNITETDPQLTDTISNQKKHNSHYLKSAALIIPGTFLVYSGLKPFVSGIQKLDDNIYSNIKTNHPGFHTNAEDY